MGLSWDNRNAVLVWWWVKEKRDRQRERAVMKIMLISGVAFASLVVVVSAGLTHPHPPTPACAL